MLRSCPLDMADVSEDQSAPLVQDGPERQSTISGGNGSNRQPHPRSQTDIHVIIHQGSVTLVRLRLRADADVEMTTFISTRGMLELPDGNSLKVTSFVRSNDQYILRAESSHSRVAGGNGSPGSTMEGGQGHLEASIGRSSRDHTVGEITAADVRNSAHHVNRILRVASSDSHPPQAQGRERAQRRNIEITRRRFRDPRDRMVLAHSTGNRVDRAARNPTRLRSVYHSARNVAHKLGLPPVAKWPGVAFRFLFRRYRGKALRWMTKAVLQWIMG